MKYQRLTPEDIKKRQALRDALGMRRSLDDIDTASMARSFAVPEDVVKAELTEARRAQA